MDGAPRGSANLGELQVTKVWPLPSVIVGKLSDSPPGRMTCMLIAVIPLVPGLGITCTLALPESSTVASTSDAPLVPANVASLRPLNLVANFPSARRQGAFAAGDSRRQVHWLSGGNDFWTGELPACIDPVDRGGRFALIPTFAFGGQHGDVARPFAGAADRDPGLSLFQLHIVSDVNVTTGDQHLASCWSVRSRTTDRVSRAGPSSQPSDAPDLDRRRQLG